MTRDILQGYEPDGGTRDILAGQPEMSWTEVGKQAIQNVPESGKEFFMNMWNALRHPIDTGGTLVDVAAGALKLIDGDDGGADEMKAKAVGEFFSDRYFSGVPGFKHALATDPVGVMGDFSAILSMGGTAAARAPGIAGKIGSIVQKAGKYTDPTTLAGKALTSGGKHLAAPAGRFMAGNFTGTGPMPWSNVASSGRKGGEAGRQFRGQMRETIPFEEFVQNAKEALSNIKREASQAYRTGMDTIAESTAILDFTKIDKAFRKVADIGTFKGEVLNPSTTVVFKKMADAIDDWRMKPPKDFHTPEGMDALKKKIGDIREGTDYGSQERLMVDKVYHAIKDEIVGQAPEYGRIMKGYENMKTATKELEKSLKIGVKHDVDQATRALTSAMRDTVNTNFGARVKGVEILEQAGAHHLMDQLAGVSVKGVAPRGLGGATSGAVGTGLAAASIYNDVLPWWVAAPGIAATSPRLTAELVHGAARGYGMAERALGSRLGRSLTGRQTRLGAEQTGQLEENLRRNY
jgi:hypothetical protein